MIMVNRSRWAMGSYLHRVESSLGEYLHKHDKDEVYGGLRYDCVDDPRRLERVPVTVGVPNDDSERGNPYPRSVVKGTLLQPTSQRLRTERCPSQNCYILGPGTESGNGLEGWFEIGRMDYIVCTCRPRLPAKTRNPAIEKINIASASVVK